MEMDDKQSINMLHDAMRRAEHLVAELSKQMQELADNPSDLPPQQQAEGKAAMTNALASARRMLESLDGALKIASVSSN